MPSTSASKRACVGVIRGQDDNTIASALLEHEEQRFRLSYPLGAWQQERPSYEDESQYEMDYEYGSEESDSETLTGDEIVDGTEINGNNARLIEYVARIKKVAMLVREQTAGLRGDFQNMDNANQRQDWLEDFTNALYESHEFSQLSLDIMDAISERFDLISAGDFERSAAGWPVLWYYKDHDRNTFLRHVRWFSSNHVQQFGRLLTPLVDGIRVRGRFEPSAELQDNERRLVFLDGEGLGHSTRESDTTPTRVTEKFTEADMILLVDDAQSPMSAAPLELLRSVGSSGHSHKLAVAFTHFDQVKGDNLGSYTQKRNHVRASIGNAISSLRDSLGAPVTEILERQLQDNDFYLSNLDMSTEKIPPGFIRDMRDLLARMQRSAEPTEQIEVAPIYSIARLELALRDAADGFKNPWRGRLGLSYYEGTRKEHWGRVKALCRRIAVFGRNEYDGLRPVADLISQLQTSISRWMDVPTGWTVHPISDDERQVSIDRIRQTVFVRMHILAQQRLIGSHKSDWLNAFGFRGTGSSYDRARVMGRIYDEAAPSVSSVMDKQTQEFLNDVVQIVCDAVEDAGGWVEGGAAERESAGVT